MNKFVALSLILIAVIISGCQATAQSSSTMTASDVCQHVNQRLKNEYQYSGSSYRYEISYRALSATYPTDEKGLVDGPTRVWLETASSEELEDFKERINKESPQQKLWSAYYYRGVKELENIFEELGVTWLVEVEVTKELQSLKEGEWVIQGVSSFINKYLFNENSGALVKIL